MVWHSGLGLTEWCFYLELTQCDYCHLAVGPNLLPGSWIPVAVTVGKLA